MFWTIETTKTISTLAHSYQSMDSLLKLSGKLQEANAFISNVNLKIDKSLDWIFSVVCHFLLQTFKTDDDGARKIEQQQVFAHG